MHPADILFAGLKAPESYRNYRLYKYREYQGLYYTVKRFGYRVRCKGIENGGSHESWQKISEYADYFPGCPSHTSL